MKGNLQGTPLVVPSAAVRCACGCARESDREFRMAEARLFVRFLYLCAPVSCLRGKATKERGGSSEG